tara:strand:+ start:2111 stop:2242 length:132 start_codon:yes stop_codon:yes gene_type:complete
LIEGDGTYSIAYDISGIIVMIQTRNEKDPGEIKEVDFPKNTWT